jgi:excisionase family DNA binding protein
MQGEQMAQIQQFFRPSEIAPMLGVSPGRVYQLIAAGEIPATRIGGSLRIPVTAWEKWLHDQSDRAIDVARSRRRIDEGR